MNRSRFRVRVRFWQKLEAFHEPSRSRWVFKLVRNAGEQHQLAAQFPG
jgi:hypothetical protein